MIVPPNSDLGRLLDMYRRMCRERLIAEPSEVTPEVDFHVLAMRAVLADADLIPPSGDARLIGERLGQVVGAIEEQTAAIKRLAVAIERSLVKDPA